MGGRLSRRPLPRERHNKKLVFPSSYTHGFGPGFQTLTGFPTIQYTAPPEHHCFQSITPMAPGRRSCFRCLHRFQSLGPVVSNRGHHPRGQLLRNREPGVGQLGHPAPITTHRSVDFTSSSSQPITASLKQSPSSRNHSSMGLQPPRSIPPVTNTRKCYAASPSSKLMPAEITR
jgi:hypothetical protein